jgi:hypothetical protein
MPSTLRQWTGRAGNAARELVVIIKGDRLEKETGVLTAELSSPILLMEVLL